jgi:hypothetical protein
LTGSETVEGFENLTTDANLTTWFDGWRTPTDDYQFDSGVAFDSLSPPNNNGDIIIGDTTIGSVGFGTSDGGAFDSSFLPSGTAYIADDGPGIGMGFIFDNVVDLAGMYVAGSDSITISAYDISNILIESFTSNTMASVSNWQSNFLGLSLFFFPIKVSRHSLRDLGLLLRLRKHDAKLPGKLVAQRIIYPGAAFCQAKKSPDKPRLLQKLNQLVMLFSFF